METSVSTGAALGQRGIDPKPWGVPAVLAGLAVPLLLWGSTLAFVLAEGEPEDLSAGEIVANIIISIVVLDGIFLATPALLALWRHHQRPAALGLRPFDRNQWWWPLGWAASAWVAVYVYSIILYVIGGDAAAPRQDDLDQLFESRAVLPLTGFATVLMAPLAEEIFFRGFVFGGLIRPFGLLPAMAFSGLLFGLFHVSGPDTIGLLLPFGLIGMLFAWIYHRTGSLWPSIATHLLFNLVSFVLLASVAGGST